MCRVRNCRTADLNTGIITNQSFNFDAASNVLADDCTYDVNNRLTSFKENSITYDADGNMIDAFLNEQNVNFVFDSRNRLISDGTHTYTYNAENTRIRSICNNVETHYTYNTNASLSQLLVKRTGGDITKYVYGLGLIGEESQGSFKTYHFDYRGSTVAITDEAGIITDTFAYDTYGKLINRTGETNTPFLYNGRDGVMTEENGLYYMRARYYSPELKRFINADVVSGEIANSPTLNRYAYANGNPISNVDPLGLSADDKNPLSANQMTDLLQQVLKEFSSLSSVNFNAKTILLSSENFSVCYLSEIGYGDGPFNYKATLEEQLELLSSFSFSNNNATLTILSDGENGIKYSYKLDQYNELIYAYSWKYTGQLNSTFSYTLKTTDDYKNSLETGFEVLYKSSSSNNNSSSDIDWGEVGAWVLAFVMVGVTIGTIVEDVYSGGLGIANDGAVIGGLTTAWGNAINYSSSATQAITGEWTRWVDHFSNIFKTLCTP